MPRWIHTDPGGFWVESRRNGRNGRNLIGISCQWEKNPPKFDLDWEPFPPNSHQIPTIPTRFTGIPIQPNSEWIPTSPTKFRVEPYFTKLSYKSHDHEISDKYKIMTWRRVEPSTSEQLNSHTQMSDLPTVPSVLVNINKLYAIYTLPLSKYNMFWHLLGSYTYILYIKMTGKSRGIQW